MRVLQIIPHFGIGGAEAMCKYLSIELKNFGHDVKIVSLFSYKTANTMELEKAGFEIVYLNKKSGIDFAVIRELKKVVENFSPDVIHSHLLALKYAFLASQNMRTPIVHTIHSVATYDSGRLSRVLNCIFLKSGRVRFVALSHETQKTIVESYKIDENKVPIVFNGVQITSSGRKSCYNIGRSVSIVNVASFQPIKNQIELLKAVLLLKDKGYDCKLSLFGDGTTRVQIESFIQQNNLEKNVCLHGFKSNISKMLPDYDVFVLPSLLEGVPLSIIEAMAAALPIVASNVGGVPDMIIDGRNGLLCEPNSESIAEKLEIIITSHQLRETIGNEAFKCADKFSSKNMCCGYIGVYNDVMKV